MTVERMLRSGDRDEYLRRAVAYCRAEYKRRRLDERCHVSFTAVDVMRDCEKVFADLGTFGVEGYCDDLGRDGISYLNTGDTYARTIIFRSGSERWSLGDFESVARVATRWER